MLCDLVFGIVGMIVLTIFVYNKQHIIKDFVNKLTSDQRSIFNSIFRERVWITVFGIIIAILVTFGLTYVISEKSWINRICLFIISLFFFTTIIYLVFPKSNNIILHLNQDQIKEWLSITNYIKFIGILGFIVGILFYFLFSKLFKKIF